MIAQGDFDVFKFPQYGVWVAVPRGQVSDVTFTPNLQFSPRMLAQEGLQPVRFLGTLKFVPPEGSDDSHFIFNPPARLQVRYTAHDLLAAHNRKTDLRLLWWNGVEWVEFVRGRTVVESHDPSDPSGLAASMYFDIPEIDDPPIIWGS